MGFGFGTGGLVGQYGPAILSWLESAVRGNAANADIANREQNIMGGLGGVADFLSGAYNQWNQGSNQYIGNLYNMLGNQMGGLQNAVLNTGVLPQTQVDWNQMSQPLQANGFAGYQFQNPSLNAPTAMSNPAQFQLDWISSDRNNADRVRAAGLSEDQRWQQFGEVTPEYASMWRNTGVDANLQQWARQNGLSQEALAQAASGGRQGVLDAVNQFASDKYLSSLGQELMPSQGGASAQAFTTTTPDQTVDPMLQGFGGRFGSLMGMLDDFSNQRQEDTNQQFRNMASSLTGDLVSRGLTGSTVASSTRQGVENQRIDAQNRLADTINQEKMNWGAQLSGDYLNALTQMGMAGLNQNAQLGGSLYDANNAIWNSQLGTGMNLAGTMLNTQMGFIPQSPSQYPLGDQLGQGYANQVATYPMRHQPSFWETAGPGLLGAGAQLGSAGILSAALAGIGPTGNMANFQGLQPGNVGASFGVAPSLKTAMLF